MLIFPDNLAGLTLDRTKTPQFSTNIKKSVNGYEVRTPSMAYPLWNFSLKYEFLRTDTAISELKTLAGFFLQCKGSYETFYFKDPYDYAVTSQTFGVGNGTSKSFQLIRSYGGFVDIIQAPLNYTININGEPTTAFTIENGVITFTTAPASGAVLSWSGEFYFPCRFINDKMDFNQFMYNLWEAKKVEFVSVKL